MIIVPVVLGINTMMILIISWKTFMYKSVTLMNKNLLQDSLELTLNIAVNPNEENLPKIPHLVLGKI